MALLVPLIIHVPHSSRVIPDDLRASFLLSDVELEEELLRMTDAFTDELFAVDAPAGRSIVFPVSRLVVDPERYRDDHKEPMAARGMGATYVTTSTGKKLRNMDDNVREDLLRRYYDPHHANLSAAVQSSLDSLGTALIIDAHSFSSFPLPHELDQSLGRPDICIGIDPFHTPREVVDLATTLFQSVGLTTAVNRPFAGSIVPIVYYRRDRRVLTLMVELNRNLFMDQCSGERSLKFKSLCTEVGLILTELTCRVRSRL